MLLRITLFQVFTSQEFNLVIRSKLVKHGGRKFHVIHFQSYVLEFLCLIVVLFFLIHNVHIDFRYTLVG